jgi:hypothetical protein
MRWSSSSAMSLNSVPLRPSARWTRAATSTTDPDRAAGSAAPAARRQRRRLRSPGSRHQRIRTVGRDSSSNPCLVSSSVRVVAPERGRRPARHRDRPGSGRQAGRPRDREAARRVWWSCWCRTPRRSRHDGPGDGQRPARGGRGAAMRRSPHRS